MNGAEASGDIRGQRPAGVAAAVGGTSCFAPTIGADSATIIALLRYTGYCGAAPLAATPAGHRADHVGRGGPRSVLSIGLGCVETAENASVAAEAPDGIRGSAFGLLATVQSVGNLLASSIGWAVTTLV